jgi:hypothetical protein
MRRSLTVGRTALILVLAAGCNSPMSPRTCLDGCDGTARFGGPAFAIVGFPWASYDLRLAEAGGGGFIRLKVGEEITLHVIKLSDAPMAESPDTVRTVKWSSSSSAVVVSGGHTAGAGIARAVARGTATILANGRGYSMWTCGPTECRSVESIVVQ